jgi:hypothetical protein
MTKRTFIFISMAAGLAAFLVYFRVQFFGGAVDVIARDFTVGAANNMPEATAG